MIIDFIRHGDVDGPACFRGRTDSTLSASGWQQLADVTASLTPSHIYSSPLKRCADFAEHWSDNKIPFAIIDEFTEMDFGDWDGKTAEEILKTSEDELLAFWNNPAEITPPNGEAYTVFQQRVLAGLQIIVENGGEHIVVITHGGVIKTMIAEILNIPDEKVLSIETPLASITRFRVFISKDVATLSLVAHGAKSL